MRANSETIAAPSDAEKRASEPMADPKSRAGGRYASSEVLAFTDGLHACHDPALQQAFSAADGERLPSIMVGPSEGKLLELLLRLAGALKVVEIGTLAGYSAIRMARALPDDGHLWSLEHAASHAEVARQNLAAAGLSDRVSVVVGAALETLPGLEHKGPFDAVFIDADKGNYDVYGRWAAAHLRPGGLLIGDNAYYFGKLMDPEDPAAAAMRRFHQETAVNFRSTCIPTPDGLLLGIRTP